MASKAKKGVSATFALPLKQLRVDDNLNPRQRAMYSSGSEEPGAERATVEQIAESMRELGQLSAVIVDRMETGEFRLREGFRRVRAASLLGWEAIDACEYLGAEIDSAALAGNTARGNLNAPELGHYIARLAGIVPGKKRAPGEKAGLKQHQIAARCGISRPHVANYCTIMASVHPRILAAWMKTPGAFKMQELLGLKDASHVDQLAWLERRYGVPSDAEDREVREKPHRARVSIKALANALDSGEYDHHGEEWLEGARAVLRALESGEKIT